MSGRLECNIVKDLLPLYKDNVVSEKTAEQIEEHLRTCESCMEEYQSMNQELPLEEVETPQGRFEETFAKYHKQQAEKSFRNLIVIVLILSIGSVVWGYITERPVKQVSDERINIMQVYEVEENGQQEFFIYYDFDIRNAPHNIQDLKIVVKDGKANLEVVINEPIYARKFDESEIYGKLSGAKAEVPIIMNEGQEPITELYFAGEQIWSEDAHGEVPEYAKVFVELYVLNGELEEVVCPGYDIDSINQTISIYQSEVGSQSETVELGIWSLEDGTKIK